MAQQRQTYHHKDLRNALIETGIQLVSTEGVNAFSLRKVAAACGVSHAAPYSHFQNKEELLEAMQLFITDRFSKQLESAVQKNNNVVEILKDRGFPLLATAQYAQIKDSIFYSAISCGTSNLYPLPKTVRI